MSDTLTTSYEENFSAMTAFKSKYRKRFQLERGLRVAVSKIHPWMCHLVSNMQAHPSHWVSTVELISECKLVYGAFFCISVVAPEKSLGTTDLNWTLLI
jgi:hypothetical protein